MTGKKLTSLQRRTYAFAIDFLSIFLINFFSVAIFKQFIATVFFYLPITFQVQLAMQLGQFPSTSFMSIMFSYFSIFYYVTNGTTIGKYVMGLQVKNKDSSPISLWQAMRRSFGYVLSSVTGFFLFALPWFRKDEKSLADFFSASYVGEHEEIIVDKNEFELNLYNLSELSQMGSPEEESTDYKDAA